MKSEHQEEKVNVRKQLVDSVYELLANREKGITSVSCGAIQVFRDSSNPYVLVLSSGGKRFKVRIKETDL